MSNRQPKLIAAEMAIGSWDRLICSLAWSGRGAIDPSLGECGAFQSPRNPHIRARGASAARVQNRGRLANNAEAETKHPSLDGARGGQIQRPLAVVLAQKKGADQSGRLIITRCALVTSRCPSLIKVSGDRVAGLPSPHLAVAVVPTALRGIAVANHDVKPLSEVHVVCPAVGVPLVVLRGRKVGSEQLQGHPA